MRKLKITEMNRLTEEQFKEVKKTPLVVILDNVRSLHNIGSVFRTADAFLIESIYLCGITSTPPHAEIHKTALGAEYSVDWQYFEQTTDAVKALQNDSYEVIAIEQVHNSTMIGDVQLNKEKKYAVVMGNEVKGVAQEVVDMCDSCVEIPQYGTKHSLNVSVTAGIIMYDFSERLRE